MNTQLARNGRDDLTLANEPQELLLQLRRIDAGRRPLHRQPRLAQPVVSGVLVNPGCSRSSSNGPSSIKNPEELFLLLVGVSLLRHCDTSPVGVATTTGIQASEGKLYCCAIKDVFSNRIVGYSISDRMTAKPAVDAVRSAVARRGEVAGCILHADRGSQFRSRAMARELRRHDMVGSMGRVGAAGDNAAMESFWSLLQTNVLNQQRWTTRQELRLAIVVWIERKYHRQRAQDTLGGLTPIEFEAKLTEPLILAA